MGLLKEEHLKAPTYDDSTDEKLTHSNTDESLPLEKKFDFGEFENPVHSIIWDDEETISAFG